MRSDAESERLMKQVGQAAEPAPATVSCVC
jgi:hypothetical protein